MAEKQIGRLHSYFFSIIFLLFEKSVTNMHLDNRYYFLLYFQISKIVGCEIRPDETTALKNILEFGLSKYIDQ